MNENREYLLRVAEELEGYTRGLVYRCSECGATIILDDEDANVIECGHCKESINLEYCEQLCICDYMQDVLDYNITINSSLEYESCKVYITLGGPNVWMDTSNRTVNLCWGCDSDSIYIDSDTSDEIDDYMKELYACR